MRVPIGSIAAFSNFFKNLHPFKVFKVLKDSKDFIILMKFRL